MGIYFPRMQLPLVTDSDESPVHYFIVIGIRVDRQGGPTIMMFG
jgi:hypothetical protein